jgi:hypothetical protein
VKHVFVESNFLIELLPPFPSKDAEELFARNDGVRLRLYIPWCSQSEATRTLSARIIVEDLGFTNAMMKFVVRRWLPDKTLFDKREIDKVRTLAEADRTDALQSLEQRWLTLLRRWSASIRRPLSWRVRCKYSRSSH